MQSESSPEEIAWSLIADARARCFETPSVSMHSLSVNCPELPGLSISMINIEPGMRPAAHDVIARSARLQGNLPELIEESPKLEGVLLKRQRKVHFSGQRGE